MPILRLAYTTQFLVALIAIFLVWSEVGGQGHLDLMPWYLKLGLGTGVAFATVKATMAAVSREGAWNGGTLKWLGITLALLALCGLTTYYYHLYGESDESDQEGGAVSLLLPGGVGLLACPSLQRFFEFPPVLLERFPARYGETQQRLGHLTTIGLRHLDVAGRLQS